MSWSDTRNVAFAELLSGVITLLGGLAKYGATMRLTVQSMSQKLGDHSQNCDGYVNKAWVIYFRLRLPNDGM